MSDLNQIEEMLSGLTLLQAAKLVKILEEKWGVSAAAPMAMAMPMGGAAPVEAAAPVEEQTEFDLILKEAGAKKIDVIKHIRKYRAELGLKEAKELAEQGGPILEAVSKEVVNEAKATFEGAGAVVQVK